MEFQEIVIYVFASLLGIIIILSILNLIFNTRIVKRFSGKYVRILANYELQSEDLSSLFTVTFFNNNMSDIKVHSFGFMYCNEQVDFYEEFTKAYYPDIKKRLVIEPSDSVKLQLSYDRMKKMLLAIRDNRSGLPVIYGYIIDANGNETTGRLKDTRKNVKRIFKAELNDEKEQRKEVVRQAKAARKEAKLKRKEEKKLAREEARKVRKQKREDNRLKRREAAKKTWHNFIQSIKKFFGKIKKVFTRKKENN